MTPKNFLAVIYIVLLAACNNQQPAATNKEQSTVSSTEQMGVTDRAQDKFKHISFDDKKDLVCGMPISAGVSDTAHYKNKVYGFCSKECKDEFVKNTSTYIPSK